MSKLQLNIYKIVETEDGKREKVIDKTYEQDSCDILYGPIEDITDVLDLKNLNNEMELFKLIATMLKQVKPILKDVFYDLTDDELKMTKPKEVVNVIFLILAETLSGIITDENLKNVMRGQK